MNLIIDQGNTATKLALFKGDNLIEKKTFSKSDIKATEEWIKSIESSKINVLVSSVTDQHLNIPFSEVIYLDHQTPIPLKNEYETPTTLGRDRLANAVAAWAKNPGGNSLVLDLGTCIKYDLVAASGTYLGGNISPGLRMRYKALKTFTDQLPLISGLGDFDFNYGTSTETSLKNGVEHAIFHEINGFIQRYDQQFGQLTIFMTGGDLKYFDKAFKNSIFAHSLRIEEDLTVYGLNEILRHNVEA